MRISLFVKAVNGLFQATLKVLTKAIVTMKIFRVENDFGVGAYSIEYNNEAIISSKISKKHPDPNEEPNFKDINWAFKGWNFGFESLKEVYIWFKASHREILKIHNVQISEYECIDYRLGFRQVIFDRSTAKLISKQELK